MLSRYVRTIYQGDNGFCIHEYKTREQIPPAAQKSGKNTFVAVGYNLPANPTTEAELTGDWETSKYGMQYRVQTYFEIMPQTEAGIAAYLGSGLLRGIGPKMAKKIVSRFGKDTLQVLENTPEQLLQIGGITPYRLEEILKDYQKSRTLRDIVALLSPYGVSVHKAGQIQDRFGNQAMAILKTQPFRLLEIKGFGFLTVDEIARKTTYNPTDTLRIKGGIRFVLAEAAAQGHLYLGYADVYRQAHLLLNKNLAPNTVSAELIRRVLCDMLDREEAITARPAHNIYLPVYFDAEQNSAQRIANLAGAASGFSQAAIADALTASQRKLGIALSQSQRAAVMMCMQNRLSIITGGPGTGKTTVLRVILDVFRRLKEGASFLLAAPTGRAARRMSESTGFAGAQTLHSALGLLSDDYESPELGVLDKDFIAVDEFSMVDMLLCDKLFRQLGNRAHVLLIGDAHQLPSVGPGLVLREIIASGAVPATCLDTVFRQAGGSRIAQNAQRIIAGETRLDYGMPDFVFLPASSDEEAANIMKEQYLQQIALSSVDDVKILTPMRERGCISAKSMNALLRELVNPKRPQKAELKHGGQVYRVGDKVMQLKNMDDINNGDIGMIQSIQKDDDGRLCAAVLFSENRQHVYAGQEMGMLTLAYALTIHKSQGSEFDTAIIPVTKSLWIMLRRELYYTAITRARKKVVLVGQSWVFEKALANTETEQRNTMLAERIRFEQQKWKEGQNRRPQYQQLAM